MPYLFTSFTPLVIFAYQAIAKFHGEKKDTKVLMQAGILIRGRESHPFRRWAGQLCHFAHHPTAKLG